MTKAGTRRFFFGGTIIFTLVFIGLTIHTHTTIAERTHADALDEPVKRGLRVWGRYNCENCHTLMGEGAYYAPDLTAIVEQRGRPYLKAFLEDPSRFYSAEEDGRLMPTLGLSEPEIDDVISFLAWVGNVDLNGWPPRPILVAGASSRGIPGVAGSQAAKSPVAEGKALFQGPAGCAACHAVVPGVRLVGSSLAGIPTRSEERIARDDYTGHAETGEAYVRESILEPSAYIIPEENVATPDGLSYMPDDYRERLSDDEVDAVVAYLMTLQE